MHLLETVDDVVMQALHEDVRGGDITAELIPNHLNSTARVITREDAVLCGTCWFDSTFKQLDKNIEIEWLVKDGDNVTPDQELCHLKGSTRALLTGERTALNFLQTISGTATVARRYAKLLEGTKTQLLDTRKTVPGLREAQKYAVRCAGAKNHRIGLFDGILIKENHIHACGSIKLAVLTAKTNHPTIPVEVEVETMDEVKEALEAEADILLLDNFTIKMMREAVTLNDGQAKLEASGGFHQEQLRETAEAGVDYISVGALTKHIQAVDLSMRLTEIS